VIQQTPEEYQSNIATPNDITEQTLVVSKPPVDTKPAPEIFS